MNKSRIIVFTLLSVILFSLASSFVVVQAQYGPPVRTQVTIPANGVFTASEEDIGVAYEIQGNPGAVGSIDAVVYNGNPQSTASVPEGVTLSSTRFVIITFNMYSGDFNLAKIYITYTDADVANLHTPYAIFKYVASTNSYVEMPSTVDEDAKMITVTVTSIDDPLFAIGGGAVLGGSDGVSSSNWAILAVSIVIIVVLVVFGVWYFRKKPV
jgi:hypothetical protein